MNVTGDRLPKCKSQAEKKKVLIDKFKEILDFYEDLLELEPNLIMSQRLDLKDFDSPDTTGLKITIRFNHEHWLSKAQAQSSQKDHRST